VRGRYDSPVPLSSPAASLTPRDRALLDALTHRVRVLTLDQVAREWWQGSRQAAQARVRALAGAGWIRSLDLLAHPLVELEGPAATWSPKCPRPAFQKLAYQLASRWKLPPVVHRALIATKQASVRLAGHGGRAPRPAEATHDIHLGQVYLGLLRATPGPASTWVSEAGLYELGFGRGSSLPDAMLLDGGDGLPTVIEFGGAYRPTKLERFHLFCLKKGLRYEVW